jgi:hypothetical protein
MDSRTDPGVLMMFSTFVIAVIAFRQLFNKSVMLLVVLSALSASSLHSSTTNATQCLEKNCKLLTTTCRLDRNCSAGLSCVEVRQP